MISSQLCYTFLFFSSLFLALHLVTATHFFVDQHHIIHIKLPDTTEQPDSQFIPLETPLNQVFGLSSQGLATATLNLSLNTTNPPCPTRLALCQVSNAFVRGPNYQRRQTRRAYIPLAESFASTACQSNQIVTQQEIENIQNSETGLAWCISRKLCPDITNYTFSVPDDNLQPNQMYLIGATLCFRNFSTEQHVDISLDGTIEFRNPDLLFPQLGFEEVLFPLFSAIIIVLLSLPLLLHIVALFFTCHRRMPIRSTVQFVIGAIFLKLLGAILTFVHFYTISQTGTRQGWYLYVRLLVASSADILFIIAFISISSGYAVMPNSWFVEDRSPIFLVYIGIVLQLLIIIAVKIMFPFQYLGAVTYTIAGSAIALIASVSSYRNSRFLERFGDLIERSHIFLKSTPIRQLRNFYILNIGIVAVAYIIKVISVPLFDYRLNRPDLLWGTMETVDAILLIWCAAFVFPRRNSALYVDLSNLSNERLHQAERWRAQQVDRQTPNETATSISSGDLPRTPPEGRTEVSSPTTPASDETSPRSPAQGSAPRARLTRLAHRFLHRDGVNRRRVPYTAHANAASQALNSGREGVGDALDPQPPWIAWTSGASLPRPNSYTWRGRQRDSLVMRREGRVTPFVHTPIVLGSPDGSSDMVKLTVGIPVAGKNIIPKAFDEKGAEIIESPSSDGSQGPSPTVVNGEDHQHAAGTSRLDRSARFGLSTRRQNRIDRRNEEAFDSKGPQTERVVVREAEGSSSQQSEANQEPGVGQTTRSLSSSTTATCCDGVVINLGLV